MDAHTKTVKSALLFTLAFALAACSKQDDQPVASTQTTASAPAFPTGNGALVMTLADCERLPDPKPADDSAAGRAAAVGQGQLSRSACKQELAARPNADLVRIREIKDREEADRLKRRRSEAERREGVKEGAEEPIKKYTY